MKKLKQYQYLLETVDVIWKKMAETNSQMPQMRMDSSSSIKFIKSDPLTNRMKHIENRYLSVKRSYKAGIFELDWTDGEKNERR